MDYIYGKLNEKVKVGVYNGINTPTANTTVDNKQHTIQVDVSKTKGTLTINANGSSSTFNGSEDVIVNLESGGNYAKLDTENTFKKTNVFEKNIVVNTVVNDLDATNKKYVDTEISNIDLPTANPTETATDTLTKIKINGITYAISGSSGVIAPTVENTTILNSDLFESIKKSNGFYHNESFYIVSYLNNNLIIASNTDETNDKIIVQWSLNTEFQNATRDEYAIATNNNLEPNPTGIITQTLSTIKLFGSNFKIVDSSKVPYVITGNTILTEQVKTDIVNAGRVVYDATTLLYPIDTDGGVGDGLTLVNVRNDTTSITSTTYDWNKDTAFSTAERSEFYFDTSSVVTTDDYNSLVSTVNNKLTKVTTNKQLYATTNTGEQSTLTYDSSFTPNTIPLRDENGNINVGESPTSSRNAISLMWINPQLEKKFNVAGGTITGDTNVTAALQKNGKDVATEEYVTNAINTSILQVINANY